MGVCPSCGKQVDGLYIVKGMIPQIWFDGDDYEPTGDIEFESDFICPECGGFVAANEDEARRILKG
jgi:hypothetical protein